MKIIPTTNRAEDHHFDVSMAITKFILHVFADDTHTHHNSLYFKHFSSIFMEIKSIDRQNKKGKNALCMAREASFESHSMEDIEDVFNPT